MPRPASAIPVGTQFSPSLVHLPAFLGALVAHSGDKAALELAVWAPGIRKKAKTSTATRRNRSLPLEAARQYGLLDDAYRATPLARRLATLPDSTLYDEFAKHILNNLGGLRVVEGVQQMQIEHRKVTGPEVARYLSSTGLRVGIQNTQINSMRMWLAEAGIFDRTEKWKVDARRKEELLGLSDEQIADLVALNPEQRAFLEALCRIDPKGEYPAARVRDVAAEIIGRSFGEESLPKAVLEPLKRAGLIEYRTGGTRGGKTAVLKATPRFQRDVLEPFMTRTVLTMDAALTAYFKRRPADIYADLKSPDPGTKGRALEAFAIYVMRLLGLRFAAWRKRSADTTGRAEIDVIMTGIVGAIPAVWQIQCKNMPGSAVTLEDVAKEVGLLPLTKATHILVLANCRITQDAIQYANKVMRDSSTVIFLIGQSGFSRIQTDPAELYSLIREQAESIARLRHEEAIRVLPNR